MEVQALLENETTPFYRTPDQYIGILWPHRIGLLVLILGPFILGAAVGLLTSWLRRRFEWDLADRTDRTMFHQVLRQFWKKGTAPLVRISLKDGPTYWGTVVLGSYEGNKEIVLANVFAAHGADDDPEVVEGFVYLRLDSVTHLQVWDTSGQQIIETYVSAQNPSRSSKKSTPLRSDPQTDVAAGAQTPQGTSGNA